MSETPHARSSTIRSGLSDAGPGPAHSSPKELSIALLVLLLVCAYLIVPSTIRISTEIPVYDTKRIAQIVLLPVIFLATLANSSLRAAFVFQLSRIPTLVGLGTLLFFGLGLASSVANADSLRGLVYSFVDVGMLGLLFVMTLTIAAFRQVAGQHFDRIAIAGVTLLGLAVGVQEMAGFWAAWVVGSSYNFDIALIHFSFPRMYNQLQTWSIPIITALPFVFARSRLAAMICVITLGLHWYLVLVTGARGSAVSLLFAFLLVALISPVARKAVIQWQLPGILLGIMIYAALLLATGTGSAGSAVNAEQTLRSEQAAATGGSAGATAERSGLETPNPYYEQSIGRPLLHTTGRTGLWRSAIKYARDAPLMGIGPMNFACQGPMGRVGSPHNLLFQILSEWGIVATGILVMLILSMLLGLFKCLRTIADREITGGVLRAMLITAVLGALVHLMVSSLLIPATSQVMAALIGGWLLGLTPRTKNNPRRWVGTAALTVATLFALSLLPFASHETVRMPSYTAQLPFVESGRPRLWQLGKACSDRVQ